MQTKFTPKFAVGDLVESRVETVRTVGIVTRANTLDNGDFSGWYVISLFRRGEMIHLGKWHSDVWPFGSGASYFSPLGIR